ncbi:MAG: NAD-dependent epimerase/dehydratase family protein [Rhodospirillales bacterium]
MKIGVSGANGFIGGHLLACLTQAGHSVRALVRDPERMTAAASEIVRIPSLEGNPNAADLVAALEGLEGIVHLAASVHVMDNSLGEAEYRDINIGGSCRLFEAAAAGGVQRFVYLSSAKAAGERSGAAPLTVETSPGPEDAYGRSKRDAEVELRRLAMGSSCRLIILRPTFVYGWPAVGNFRMLLSAVLKGIPLPLGGIRNRRDMTYVGNLADAIRQACIAPGLGEAPYFICDHAPVSTPQFVAHVARAFARPARLIYMPVWMLRVCGAMTGRSAMVARLIENFEVDGMPFRRDAGWQPPYNMPDGLAECARLRQDSIQVEKKSA